MKELFVETTRYLKQRDASFEFKTTTGLLGLWWILWIISSLLGQVSLRISLKAESVNELTTGTMFDMINGVIGVALGLVTINVIRDYKLLEGFLTIEEEQKKP
jgi:lantibiotic modifying enzyme